MPTPGPDDFATGPLGRRKEFSRDIGQDWNIRQVDQNLVATYKPTGTDYVLAPEEVAVSDYAVGVRSSVGTNAPNGAATKIVFNTVRYDRSGNWRPGTNDYLVSKSGLYEVSGAWLVAAGTAGILVLQIYVNGARVSDGEYLFAGGNVERGIGVYDTLELNVNDVVDLRILNLSGSGSGTAIASVPAGWPRFSIRRVGPLIP